MKKMTDNCIMVIFGATGDLTHRKLMPALYYLEKQKRLPAEFKIVAVGRKNKTSELYAHEMRAKIISNIREVPDETALESILGKITYHRQDLNDETGYVELKKTIKAIGKDDNILYYLAVAPEYFEIIAKNLEKINMAYKKSPWRRIVIEKPFGRDLESAERLNEEITKSFPESSIYRVDHYLGKEMLQNILSIRFANAVFEPVWNNEYVDNVQISSCETLGVETRGEYYESSGVLRDMVQNHLLQLLTLTAMEQPKKFDEEDIRNEKLKVLKQVVKSSDKVESVCGQYGEGEENKIKVKRYRDEHNVSESSETATFAAIKLFIDNERWNGVPFYIRTGKRLAAKTTEVVIEFKNDCDFLGTGNEQDINPNLLIIKIHPEEGVEFRFNAKVPRTINDYTQVKMDFCQNCQTGMSSPEAYERLLYDAIRGDATLFTRWDEVEQSWIFIDKIHEEWGGRGKNFPNYSSGSWGPEEAHELLKKDGRKWWVDSKNLIGQSIEF